MSPLSHPQSPPSLKGIFVKSHVQAVRRACGDAGVKALETCIGRSVDFTNDEFVPIRDEVRLLECAIPLLSEKEVPPESLSFEAGRLHFRNFAGTPFGKILFFVFRKDFKRVMLNTRYVAGHIFRGVQFDAEDLGPQAVRVSMHNVDYPIEHFRGLFYEWMVFSGHSGEVEAEHIMPHAHAYTMRFDAPAKAAARLQMKTQIKT